MPVAATTNRWKATMRFAVPRRAARFRSESDACASEAVVDFNGAREVALSADGTRVETTAITGPHVMIRYSMKGWLPAIGNSGVRSTVPRSLCDVEVTVTSVGASVLTDLVWGDGVSVWWHR